MFKRSLLLACGYLMMMSVGILLGAATLTRGVLMGITMVAVSVFDYLEHAMVKICTWDEENRQ